MPSPRSSTDSLVRSAALLDRMGEPLDERDYEWHRATSVPLTSAEQFALVYAAQVEWGTEGTFESLDISDDPVVKRFLRTWLEQERVHGELLVRFLAAHGVAVRPIHREPEHQRGAQRGRSINRLARRVVGRDFFAVHMAWGAVNELTTLRFYQVIRRRTSNPVLRDLLRDVIAQEALHYSFYRTAAVERLADRPRAQRLARIALSRLWRPVGLGLRTRDDADRLIRDLLAPSPDLVDQIDAQISSMPGLAAFRLIGDEVDAVATRPIASAGC